MDSLYGGKQGISFVIKASFESVEKMKNAFARGGSYTDVWWNEYCLIDTRNKNDKDNGKIFRRGLDYQNPSTRGAIYIGQIVGPSSGTPYFQMNTIPEVEKQSKIALEDYEYRRYPTGYKTDSEGHVIGYETSDGKDGKPIAQFPFSKAHDTSLVPGRYFENGQEKYRDEIKWTWCNIRKDNADADSWFYVGFEIPYTITDYHTVAISPYGQDGNLLGKATTRRLDDETHPYYAKWELGIPKGIKGDTLRNLKVIKMSESYRSKIYSSSAVIIDPQTGETSVGMPGYVGIDDDIEANRQILVFEYYVYDKKINPDPILIYLGDFNIITEINLADDGTLTVSYTHDNDTVFERKIRWITGVQLTTGDGAEGGHFEVSYNNGTPPFSADLTWVKGIEISENGTVTYTHAGTNEGKIGADGIVKVEKLLKWIKTLNLNPETGKFDITYNNDAPAFTTTLDWIKNITFQEDGTVILHHTKDGVNESKNNLIKWVESVELNNNTGLFTMNFNYGSPYTSQLDWVDNITINQDTGEIIIHHVNGNIGDVSLDAKLKLITRAEASADGVITFFTNTNEQFQILQNGKKEAFHIQMIDTVVMNSGIEEDKRLGIKYNTKSQVEYIGNPINYVQDMVVRESDYHLLVLYNDPTHRANREDLDEYGKHKVNRTSWVNNVVGTNGQNYGERVYWQDMGAIKDQAGVLVGFNLTRQDIIDDIGGTGLQDNANPKEYLEAWLPNGLTGEQNSPGGVATKGKIVTFSENETDDKEFYAFDYNSGSPGKWIYLGKIADSGMRDAKLCLTRATEDDIKKVSTQGLLFISDNIQYSSDAIPSYWDVNYKGWL